VSSGDRAGSSAYAKEESTMRKSLMATASAAVLLLGTAPLMGEAPAAAQEQTEIEQPINGEALADDPAHGMGEGDDAIGGGVSTHTLEGERGFASLDDDERQEVHIDREASDWTLDELIGAAIVDGDGQAIGGIEDLIVDEDDQIRKVVLEVTADGDDGHFVLVQLDELQRSEGDAGEELVFTGELDGGDHERVERQDERWLPIGDE
jgi:sporulation protein YlmC with PRC-barrel domain